MSQSTRRQRRNEKTFEDLPPRVVIYDILNYHEIMLDYSLDEFDLFGYYKRDRRRSVWFLFQSLCFLRLFNDDLEDNTPFPVVKIEKLHSLQWGDNCSKTKVFQSFLETLKRTNMYLLKRLTILNFASESLCGLFSSHNRFPKLTHLTIHSGHISKDWKWDEERIKSLQETLTSLYVFNSSWKAEVPDFGFPLVGNNVSFSLLKKICFVSIHFSNLRTIHLRHLEEVEFWRCQNLVVIPGSNVSSVKLGGNPQPNDQRELFLRSKRIKHLELRSYELFNNSNQWFYEESTNPMENLSSLKLLFYERKNENFDTFLGRIKDQLNKFKVSDCPSLQDYLLESGFEKLEVLKINDTDQLLQKDTKWGFASQLKKLVLHFLSQIFPHISIFFKLNNFSSLEVLNLTRCLYVNYEVSSSSFAPLKNLKELKMNSSYIGDFFFAEQDFENLEVLEIYWSRSTLSGNGWKRTKFNKLKEIRVSGEGVSNDLFKLIEFPALRKLELKECNRITGEGWLPIPNFVDIKIVDCDYFSNEKILEIQNKGVK